MTLDVMLVLDELQSSVGPSNSTTKEQLTPQGEGWSNAFPVIIVWKARRGSKLECFPVNKPLKITFRDWLLKQSSKMSYLEVNPDTDPSTLSVIGDNTDRAYWLAAKPEPFPI